MSLFQNFRYFEDKTAIKDQRGNLRTAETGPLAVINNYFSTTLYGYCIVWNTVLVPRSLVSNVGRFHL